MALLVYNMGKTVLRAGDEHGLLPAVGQLFLCVASFWNAWTNKVLTNGGANCLRPKRYRLWVPPFLRPCLIGSTAGASGKQTSVWRVPDWIVMGLVCVVTLLPFAPLVAYGMPDS